MDQFRVAAAALANDLGTTVVIRPHPMENSARWRTLFRGNDKVKVATKLSSTPWILGSDLVIQNGCTTGIEAIISGIPTVSFDPRPTPDEIHGSSPSNARARQVDSLAGLVEVATEPKRHVNLENVIAERSRVHGSGSTRPLETISKEILHHVRGLNVRLPATSLTSNILSGFHGRIRDFSWRNRRSAGGLQRLKRPYLDRGAIAHKVRAAHSALGFSNAFGIVQCGPQAFLLTPRADTLT